MGLKGSGSNTIVFDHARIPAHWAIEDALMVDMDVSHGTPGLELHGNPMYAGRALCCFTMTLTAVAIGAAYQALDEYEEMLPQQADFAPADGPTDHGSDLPALVRRGAREDPDR
jgi:3-hydroxy-9,10-secoandrosta-1,3,5(10)-triene-9,17-dione monooxygenase